MTMAPDELSGLLAMMPAFATADGADYGSVDTVATDELVRAVRAAIDDGIGVIATTGSFGEFHTLTDDEWSLLVAATVEASGGRVPIFAGCTDVNPRAAIERARAAIDIGADGVLMGIPYYFPSTSHNAVEFISQLGQAIPDASIMLYHNPVLHKIEIPPAAVAEMMRRAPNLVAAKDGNRDSRGFTELVDVTGHRLAVFCAPWQYQTYQPLGAAGFWSYDLWMGPRPHRALLDAVDTGDTALATSLTTDLHGPEQRSTDLSWRETLAKLAVARAGYCDPGPLRPPFVHIPDEIMEKAARRAENWRAVAARIGSGAKE